MRKIYLTLILGLFLSVANAQIAGPDSICKGNNVNYTTTLEATSYAWSPDKVVIDNSSITTSRSTIVKSYGAPQGICMVEDNGSYYAFVAIKSGKLLRVDYGTDPTAPPLVYGTLPPTLVVCLQIARPA